MSEDDELLIQDIRDIFAVVPEKEALAARHTVLREYREQSLVPPGPIKWIEFLANGNYLRAGIASVAHMSTRMIGHWSEDSDIAAMHALSSKSGVRAGQLLAAGPDSFYWFVPYSTPDTLGIEESRVRGLCVTQEWLTRIIKLFNPETELTASELRTIFQILSGSNPGSAAQADKVSVETKRTHLKRACAKLGCAGQHELIRLLMGQMIRVIYLCEVDSTHLRITQTFTTRHLDSGVRFSIQHLRNGRQLRFWEMGPHDGHPLLFMHGFLSPFLLINAPEHLAKHNIRLITPVRSGYLDDLTQSEAFHAGTLCDDIVEDISLFVEDILAVPIDLLGDMFGGFFALQLEKKIPDLFGTVIINSMHILGAKQQNTLPAGKFLSAVGKLARRDRMYKLVTRGFHKAVFSSETAFKLLLRRIFKGSPIDISTALGDVGAGYSYEWWGYLLKNSPLGVASDFRYVTTRGPDILKAIDRPVVFLHGVNNTFTTLEEIDNLATDKPQIRVVSLPDAGLLGPASHPQLFWDEIARNLG